MRLIFSKYQQNLENYILSTMEGEIAIYAIVLFNALYFPYFMSGEPTVAVI
jgi:hypothetical protein